MAVADKLRTARLPDDAERLAQSDFRAFREGTPADWLSYYRDNPHVQHDGGVLLVERGADIVGQAALLRFDMALAGVDVPMMGVAAVGVAPEARRQGVADRLMREALRRMRKAGVALSLLYPFAMRYYRRFGYELCEWNDHLRVSPSQLPQSSLRKQVRMLRRERDGEEAEALYESTRLGASGPLKRSRWWWDDRVWKRSAEWHGYRDPQSGRLTGLLGYDVPASPGFPRQEIFVRELTTATPDAFLGLCAFLAGQGDQIVAIDMALPRGQAAGLLQEHRLHPEPRVHRRLGAHAEAGAMARLVDVAAAFALHPGPARADVRGKLGLDVDDALFPDQRQLDVELGARGAKVRPGTTSRDRITLSVQQLAQVYFRTVSAKMLLRMGRATGSARAAALLDAVFAGPPLYLGAGNYF